eukprot:TRINITY_DN3539_c1_g3_i3.p9 TRINITY_DN3539_c1_g3~~TRINITY_DN3539_c1_g3_i3.p9  ORF type:complete len:142 (-),score=2.16 TRINITY_DN3539_c1_g3_i3:2143-2568(-)
MQKLQSCYYSNSHISQIYLPNQSFLDLLASLLKDLSNKPQKVNLVHQLGRYNRLNVQDKFFTSLDVQMSGRCKRQDMVLVSSILDSKIRKIGQILNKPLELLVKVELRQGTCDQALQKVLKVLLKMGQKEEVTLLNLKSQE